MESKLTLKPEYRKKLPQDRLYGSSLPLLALTGGIATGKSTVANKLRQRGLAVLCADQLVKKVYQKPEALDFVQKSFPEAILNQLIHFPTLRKIAFQDENQKKKLEQFIYAHLEGEFKQALQLIIQEKSPSFVIYDIPLLFERNLQSRFDLTLCVYAPLELQLSRLKERDHIEPELAHQMLKAQKPIEEKKALANFVIDNQGDLKDLDKEIEKVLGEILTPCI